MRQMEMSVHAYQAEMLQTEANSAGGLLLLRDTTKIIPVVWSLLEPLPYPVSPS